MKTSVYPKLHWTEHYVQYGFAIVQGLVGEDFIAEALAEVKRLVGNNLPLEEWNGTNIPKPSMMIPGESTPVLNRIYDQPKLRAAIDEMFGSPERFNNDRCFQLFVKPCDPTVKRALAPAGHIDFVSSPIPALGSGFLFQVSLVDKEPFGGNITVWPGTHKIVQRCVMNDRDWQYPKNWDDIPKSEPFEFIPKAGDVLFFHHLVAHEGNPCCTRMPRVSLHCQASCDEWLDAIDPGSPNLSPWERSLAQNGPFQTRRDEKKLMLDYFGSQKSKAQKAKLAEQYR